MNFRNVLLEEATLAPAGITSLARRAKCSTPTARKHLLSLVKDGTIKQWPGSRGNVYGNPDNSSKSNPRDIRVPSDPIKPDVGSTFIAHGMLSGKRCRISIRVVKTTRTGNKLQVASTHGKFTVVWDATVGGWVGELKSGKLTVRPK